MQMTYKKTADDVLLSKTPYLVKYLVANETSWFMLATGREETEGSV